MATQIQLRRGTASAWTSANPVLAQGEMGLETDTGKFKVGNGTSNWSSLVYASGLQGPQGFQGTTGPQGTQGVQGPAASIAAGSVTIVDAGSAASVTNSGTSSAAVFNFTLPRGDQGVQGAQGVQGTVGSQGPQGFQGAVGPQGAVGAQGTQGVQGAVGSQGPQGFQGSTGPQGVTGAQGVQGAVGSQGPQGFQGVNGAQGTQGVQGAVGSQGPQGFQGAVGPQGVQGVQGAVGAQGNQGFQGANGAQGPQGSQGSVGAQGAQGFQGNDGAQGAAGSQGAQGPQGSQGVGVATGGTTNQFLVKNSGTNFDTAWSSALVATSANVTAASASSVPVTINGAASQTANLTEWKNSSGGVLAGISPIGQMLFTGASSFAVGLYADSGGPVVGWGVSSSFDAYGRIDVAGGILRILGANDGLLVTRSTNGVVQRVRGVSGQTSDLEQWQNSSGTVLARVTSSGEVRAALIDGGSA